MFGSENNIDILLGARGAGVPEYGFRDVEQHGVWWKTRGLKENTGSKSKTRGSLYFGQL